MPASARIEPTHPDAYRPRFKLLPERPASLFTATLRVVIIVGVFFMLLRPWPVLGAAIAVVALAVFVLRRVIRRRRADYPVVVDQLGLIFGATGPGDAPRLVPWESVTAVVLFDVPRTDTAARGWQHAIGARLAGHPDGVAVQRPLAGWTLDRAALQQAVTRFGGGVPVVDGERADAAPTPEQLRRMASAAYAQAPVGEPVVQPGTTQPGPAAPPSARTTFVWRPRPRYQQVDPSAYLARFDLRSNLPIIAVLVVVQVVVWAFMVPQSPGAGILFAVVFAIPLVLVLRSLRSGGAVALAVDRPGVYFGTSTSPGDDQTHRLVPWTDITAVVVYETLVDGSDSSDTWQRAVGVRLRGEPTVVQHWRVVHSWTLDRPALETAVARFGPGVRVIDGAPQRPPRARDVMQALRDAAPPIDEAERQRRIENWGR